jgi:hypothetical protein
MLGDAHAAVEPSHGLFRAHDLLDYSAKWEWRFAPQMAI